MNNVSLLLTFLYELVVEKPKATKLNFPRYLATKHFWRGLVSQDVTSLLPPYLLILQAIQKGNWFFNKNNI